MTRTKATKSLVKPAFPQDFRQAELSRFKRDSFGKPYGP